MFHPSDNNSKRLTNQPQIPIITRRIVSNTANASQNNSRIQNNITPKNSENPVFERSKTQEKLRKNFYTINDSNSTKDLNSERIFTDNLVKANNEISILRKELQLKNNELSKLKQLGSIKDKCHTPYESSG